jgi:hypothetical protein
MALSVSQIIAVSYNAVLAEARKAANQWAEAAFLREAERQGMVIRKALGPQIEAPLDYQRNPGATFLATSLQQVSGAETEIVTAAVYEVAEISVPVTWTKKTEATNSSEKQKIDLSKQLLLNGFDSHDDLIEQAVFATSTNGFLGFGTLIPDSGQSSAGGIDSTSETMWRSQNATYVDDTDVESAFTSVWNASAKGSGSALQPTMMVSDSTTQALFEGTQQAQQRWVDTQDLKAGFKTLAFKTARYVFSKNGTTDVFFLNPKNYQIVVSSSMYREKGETQELVQQGQNGYRFLIYSALQAVTNNRSRLGVAHT